jgi:hypothetical protein
MTFRSKRDFNTHRLLRAIHYNSLLSKLEPTQQADEKDQFLNFEDWKQCYAHFPELVDRTIQLFQSCHVDFKFGDDATPQNPVTFTTSSGNINNQIIVTNTDYFPSSGYIYHSNGSNNFGVFRYTSKTKTSFLGCLVYSGSNTIVNGSTLIPYSI